MSSSRPLTAAGCAAILVLTLPGALLAQPSGDEATYRALVETGVQEFGLGHLEEALSAFQRAYAVRPGSRVLRGLAKVRFEMRQYTAALEAAEAALSYNDSGLTPEMRAEVESIRQRAQGFVGLLSLQVTPSDAEVLVDGRAIPPERRTAPFRVDIGARTLEVSAPGYSTTRRTVEVPSGGIQLSVALTASRGNALTVISAITGLVGAAGVVGASLWLVDRTDAVDRCQGAIDRGARCTNAEALASERDLSIGTLVGASVLTAASAVAFFATLGAGGARPAESPSVACAPSQGGLFCAGAVRW